MPNNGFTWRDAVWITTLVLVILICFGVLPT